MGYMTEAQSCQPNLVFSPVSNLKANGSLMEYTFSPARGAPVDFIYVDGPALYSYNKIIMEPVLFDNVAKVIVVDGRREQVEMMTGALMKSYDVEDSLLENRTVFRRRW